MSLPKSTTKFIFYFARQQWLKFVVLITTSVIWAFNDSFFPYFLKRIINALSSYHGARLQVYSAVSGTLLLLGIFWLANEVFMRVQGITSIYTFPKFRASMRSAVFKYVGGHSHEYFSSHFSGNIAKRLSDLPTSSQTLMEIICFQFVTAGVGASIVLVMMWMMKPMFAMVLSAWLCAHLGLTFICMRRGNQLWENHSEAASTLSGKIVDIFTNISNVRLFARNRYEKQYIEKFQEEEVMLARKAMWLIEFMRLGLGISGLALIFGMVSLLLYGWAHQWVTLGDFTQVGMQTFWLLGWIWFVSFQITVFAREAGTISDALVIVKKDHDLVDVENAVPIVIQHGTICFQNVEFSYRQNQGRAIFQNFNLEIPSGQKIGLGGFSGSGKSTFVNLILRFYDLQSGKILIDGVDISSVTQESLRSQISMIPQDPALFHRSLMENIRYGNLAATDEEVFHAARLAHCEEFILKLDQGYESLVGERGIKLSGGQRQRIAIARAILKNAPILILDEATSSLDSVTEKLIQESLRHLMQNRTTIIIAHRLSTLSNMDRILVFDQGRIVESGTQEELLYLKGHFAKLWNMQINGFLPDESGIGTTSSVVH